MTEARAHARLRADDDGLKLVLDMPPTRGLDAVPLPGGGTRDLRITTVAGEPVAVQAETFERQMDGGRVVVDLGDVTVDEVQLAGVLEARTPAGEEFRSWPLPEVARTR